MELRDKLTFALFRWDGDIEDWCIFWFGSAMEELNDRVAHYVGKGYDGPWQLMIGGKETVYLQSTERFFKWLRGGDQADSDMVRCNKAIDGDCPRC